MTVEPVGAMERWSGAVLYALLLAFIVVITHNFFAYVDHYPYLSYDDGLSAVSTSLLQIGRYGDPSIPVEPFSGAQRYHGFFNYGPWYFFTGAAVLWLVGFSLKALRALHLLTAFVMILCARRLFGGLRGAVAATIVGLGAGYLATQITWPMFRPDVFVTLFAVFQVWAAARAAASHRAALWFVCGLAAGCGALTHLVGAALVPASLVAMAFACWGDSRKALIRSTFGLVGGWLLAALMFYGSFGFRVADHLQLILNYRAHVQGTASAALGATTPLAVWQQHYRIATASVDGIYLVILVIAVLAALAIVIRKATDHTAFEVRTLLVPGCAVWLLCVVELAFYQNFHSGYVILPQMFAVWVVASTLYVGLGLVRARPGRIATYAAALLMIACALRLTYVVARAENDPRLQLARSWIGISNYIDEVLGPVPEGSVAWGSETFAIEGPQRLQLTSLEQALRVMERVPESRRRELEPDYLVWGHLQNEAAITLPFLDPPKDPLPLLKHLLPRTQFSVASLTAAAPYGTTHVYARDLERAAAAPIPFVSAWDSDRQRWLHQPTALSGVSWTPARGVLNIRRASQRWSTQAADAVTADLPGDWYLLRIRTTGAPSPRRFATVSAGSVHEFASGDLPPGAMDVAVMLTPQPGYALVHHGGGALGVDLFADDAASRIESIETFRVGGFADYRAEREREREQPLPDLSTWTPDATNGVTASGGSDVLFVSGNASPAGYQIVSPRVPVPPGSTVVVRLPVTVSAGQVCTGVLDELQQQWIVPPADHADVHRFDARRNRGVYVVLANCNEASRPAASRFSIRMPSFSVSASHWYVDSLMRFW